MTCFSPLDRKALYEALGREAQHMAQACTDEQMRRSFLHIAEHCTVLIRMEERLGRALRPESIVRETSRDTGILRKRYAGQPEDIAVNWSVRKTP